MALGIVSRFKMAKENDLDVRLSNLNIKYTQDPDSCDTSGNSQELELEIDNAGGGIYYILKTGRWAFENVKELTNIVKDFEKRVNLETKLIKKEGED